ncbi:hypothetical protein HAX54_039596 [Datura stramonium]|uniref:peroxidase n=1 Tax=Datura stramonium TaxID=4076 RepID=A0ABS8VM64_DATST|nr:hypothetical protein [Datura stramonium]
MVALSGLTLLGSRIVREFSSNLYNYNKTSQSDLPTTPRFAKALRDACGNYQKDPTISVFNDVMSPNKFDNMYYQNLPKGLGLLSSDRAMQKLSEHGVKIGRRGEIRHRSESSPSVLFLFAFAVLQWVNWNLCIQGELLQYIGMVYTESLSSGEMHT